MHRRGSAEPWPPDRASHLRELEVSEADGTVLPESAPDAPETRPAWRGSDHIAYGAVAAAATVLLVLVFSSGRAAASPSTTWQDAVRRLNVDGPIKFGLATVIGLLITAVHRPKLQDPWVTRSMAHAQILLCLSGALMMVLISDSLARAFGIAGAAGLIRFRTPVEDPKDAAVLFLLIALGMAVGIGNYALAGWGAVMLCGLLWALEWAAAHPTRAFLVELVAGSDVFPFPHVQQVFARHNVVVEPREVCGGDPARVKYLAVCRHELSLETLNADLLSAGTSSLRAVAWEPVKKKAR